VSAELIIGPASPPFVLFTRLALALGAGVFVGLERERRGKPGARTFALVCAMAGVGGALGDGYSWAVLGIVGVLVVLLNMRQLVRRQDIELTTSAALFIVAFVGILIGRGWSFVPVALAVVTAALLAWKQSLHDFAGGLSEGEIRSAIMLALLALVMFPLLPEEPVDRWSLVHPRAAGVAVIVLAALGWANYLLWRTYGARGMNVASLLGGLVNSTAAVAELAQRTRVLGAGFASFAGRGVVLATAAMLLRNAVIAGMLSPPVLGAMALPLGGMVAACVLALWRMDTRWLPAIAHEGDPREALKFDSPFSLPAVLRFGAIFLALGIAGTLAQRGLGDVGFYAVSIAGGLFSSSSAVAAAGTLAAQGAISVEAAASGALLANLTSACVNLPLVARLGRFPRLTRAVAVTVSALAAAGLLGWCAQRWLL
jgi:uncharacterized membrane protein (DUF4010 family)